MATAGRGSRQGGERVTGVNFDRGPVQKEVPPRRRHVMRQREGDLC